MFIQSSRNIRRRINNSPVVHVQTMYTYVYVFLLVCCAKGVKQIRTAVTRMPLNGQIIRDLQYLSAGGAHLIALRMLNTRASLAHFTS